MPRSKNGFIPAPMETKLRYRSRSDAFPSVRGFTLIELLIVIAIIMILAGTIVAVLGTSRDRARTTRTENDLRSLQLAIEFLVNDTALLPNGQSSSLCVVQADGNEIVLNAPDAGIVQNDAGFTSWKGPYATKNLLDPWGDPYWFDPDYDCSQGIPQGCEGQPQWVQAVVSSGPNKSGVDVYDADNIVRVRCRDS